VISRVKGIGSKCVENGAADVGVEPCLSRMFEGLFALVPFLCSAIACLDA
jgi:hypothetical protein